MTTDTDLTESLRRDRLAALNAVPTDRRTLEERHGWVWDPQRDLVGTAWPAGSAPGWAWRRFSKWLEDPAPA